MAVTGSTPPGVELQLREWEQAMETTRHFNDLLIRLRGIALPLVVAAGGVAVSANLHGKWTHVPSWALIVAYAFATVGLAGVLFIGGRAGTDATENEVTALPHRIEWIVYMLADVALACATLALLGRATRGSLHYLDVPIELPLLGLATLIVATVYALDRYYYFRLLVGAVRRAEHLEAALQMQLTKTITATAPPTPARIIVTALYLVPLAAGLLAILLFALAASPSH